MCAHWESFLGEIILDVVTGEVSGKKANRRYATFDSRRCLENLLLFPDKDYLALPTLKKAEQIAGLFVANSRPLSAVSDSNRTFLQQAAWIRNAIAHQSAFAIATFRSKVPGVGSLAPPKRIPGAFLRHEFRVSPTQRRVDLYFAAFQGAAREIALAW